MTLFAAWSGDRRRLGSQFPPAAHLPSRHASSLGRVGLYGPTLSVAHYLDAGPPAAQLVQRVLSPLALSLGTADLVRRHLAARLALLSAAAWWASPSTTPACARPASPFPRRAITAIPSRLPFMSTSCAACAFSRRLCCCPCTGGGTPVAALCPCALKRRRH